jgi:hypothetical protein
MSRTENFLVGSLKEIQLLVILCSIGDGKYFVFTAVSFGVLATVSSDEDGNFHQPRLSWQVVKKRA